MRKVVHLQGGFTLIELLVVVAIITILAAILFPVFSKARAKAYQSHCTSNQRQLAIAIQTSSQDRDELLPLPSEWVAATGMSGDAKIFDCPSNSHKGVASDPDYAYNAYLFDLIDGAKTELAVGAINNPTEVELTIDSEGMTPAVESSGNPFPRSFTANGVTGGGSIVKQRHTGGAVLSFLDGHVGYRKGANGFTMSEYGIPGVASRRVLIDFSQFSNVASAKAAMDAVANANYNYYYNFTGGTATFTAAPGSFDNGTKTWNVTGTAAGTRIYFRKQIGDNGLSMVVEYNADSSAKIRFTGGTKNYNYTVVGKDQYIHERNNTVYIDNENKQATFGTLQAKVFNGGSAYSYCTATPLDSPGVANLPSLLGGRRDTLTTAMTNVRVAFTGLVRNNIYLEWPGVADINRSVYAPPSWAGGMYVWSNASDYTPQDHPMSAPVHVKVTANGQDLLFDGQNIASRNTYEESYEIVVYSGTLRIKKLFIAN